MVALSCKFHTLGSEAGVSLKAQGKPDPHDEDQASQGYIMKPLREKQERKGIKLIFASCPLFTFLVSLYTRNFKGLGQNAVARSVPSAQRTWVPPTVPLKEEGEEMRGGERGMRRSRNRTDRVTGSVFSTDIAHQLCLPPFTSFFRGPAWSQAGDEGWTCRLCPDKRRACASTDLYGLALKHHQDRKGLGLWWETPALSSAVWTQCLEKNQMCTPCAGRMCTNASGRNVSGWDVCKYLRQGKEKEYS